jgi:hypothetical protein
MKQKLKLFVFLLVGLSGQVNAQTNQLQIIMDEIESSQIDSKSIFNYHFLNLGEQIQNCSVVGEIRFRGNNSFIKYSYTSNINKGDNSFASLTVKPLFTYSDNNIKKLFEQYHTLPSGSFSYCIYIYQRASLEQNQNLIAEDCIYGNNINSLLINLVNPEDKAKLSEQYPMFNWIVNSNIQSELDYRLRVTDLKDGQNPQNAILRNRAILDEKGIKGFQLVYPINSPLLEKWQYYVWTVDAYYKNLLLGSAETWKFVLVDDSITDIVPKEVSYLELNIENGSNLQLIPGILKLKYIENKVRNNKLTIRILNENHKLLGDLKVWDVVYNENFKEFDLTKNAIFKHRKVYFIQITDESGNSFTVKLKYFNPEFL